MNQLNRLVQGVFTDLVVLAGFNPDSDDSKTTRKLIGLARRLQVFLNTIFKLKISKNIVKRENLCFKAIGM